MSTKAAAPDREYAAPGRLPRLSDQIRIGPTEYIGGAIMHLGKHADTGKYYRMGEKEVFLLRQLDGQSTSEEILEKYRCQFGKTLTAPMWRDVLSLFVRRGLTDAPGAVELRPEVKPLEQVIFMQPGPLSKKLIFWNPDRLVTVIAPYFRWLINGPVFTVWALIAVVSEYLVFTHFQALRSDFLHHPAHTLVLRGLSLVLISYLVMALHEFGHAVACKRYGGEVQEIGFLVRYLTLFAYARIDDILLLQKRSQRVYALMIGPLINLTLIPVALYAWLNLPASSVLRATATDVLLWYNLACLIQLIPFLQFDGYFMLAQLLRMPDLRKDSYRYLLSELLSRTHSRPRMAVSSTRSKYLISIYVVYGTLSLIVSSVGIGFIIANWGRSLIRWMGMTPGIVFGVLALGFLLWRIGTKARQLFKVNAAKFTDRNETA